jgi:hypothetical protein
MQKRSKHHIAFIDLRLVLSSICIASLVGNGEDELACASIFPPSFLFVSLAIWEWFSSEWGTGKVGELTSTSRE